jgi:addiction module HigA family antidote
MTISRTDLLDGKADLSDVVDATAPRIGPIAPGELLRTEWLEPLGITAYRLAKDIGVPRNRVTAILAGDRTITADTALRLARYLGADAESWLNLQAHYDLAVERQAHGAEIEQVVRPRAA